MRKLLVFNNVTLDGYFADPKGDISWAHHTPQDEEFKAFVAENAGGGGQLMFGRITYQMMVQYWPTPMAKQNDPQVAEGMNRMPKVVFSRTLDQVSWSNTTLLKGDLASEVRRLKQEPGKDIVILGSGSLVAQLTGAGLIDGYQIMVNPVVLGDGRTMFDGLKKHVSLKLGQTRAFKNGNVLLTYERAA
jgi:dihydrofolate reductase